MQEDAAEKSKPEESKENNPEENVAAEVEIHTATEDIIVDKGRNDEPDKANGAEEAPKVEEKKVTGIEEQPDLVAAEPGADGEKQDKVESIPEGVTKTEMSNGVEPESAGEVHGVEEHSSKAHSQVEEPEKNATENGKVNESGATLAPHHPSPTATSC
ncbi:Hypothetical predicted protein [Olea europaea subsp. europaea]|uniref:Uncharacterized protein n=1 Tax=Olea europaea subsp. europaea TaxID=158383 RepID=A0A8S0TNQ6_OLEEU|nr:Hypothetical predicted protein [Olea europaea subsp. europaea]